MAERRMFAKTIIDSDAFLEMPISARLLYYDLSMRADDDGFVNSPKKIMKFIGATNDDMNILIARKFVLAFDNGIVVIKHWRIHNYIRKDTYNETPYLEQKAMLELDEKKAYRLKNSESQLLVDETRTQVRLGKDSIDYREIYEFYENQIGILNPVDYEKLDKLIDKYGEDKVKDAINTASDNNGKSINYIKSILTNGTFKKKEKDVPEWMNKELESEEMSSKELDELEKDFEIFEEV